MTCNTEYVRVPKYLLDKLEQDRVKIYNLLDHIHDNSRFSDCFKTLNLSNMTECTNTMWRLANSKWEKVND